MLRYVVPVAYSVTGASPAARCVVPVACSVTGVCIQPCLFTLLPSISQFQVLADGVRYRQHDVLVADTAKATQQTHFVDTPYLLFHSNGIDSHTGFVCR